MKRLKSMTVNQVLKSYSFPRKFYVRYALDCALTVKHLMTDKRSLKALEITELWLQGKATDEEVRVAANNAYAAYAATSFAHAYDSFAHAFASAAHASASASYASSYASSASYTSVFAYTASTTTYASAANATSTLDTTLKDLLLKQIETLSEFQRLMLGIEV